MCKCLSGIRLSGIRLSGGKNQVCPPRQGLEDEIAHAWDAYNEEIAILQHEHNNAIQQEYLKALKRAVRNYFRK